MLKSIIALLFRLFVIKANFDCPGTKSIAPSCRRFALNKKGLALNFSPPEEHHSGDVEIPEYNCQVLKCAESEIGLSLVNDTRYDYYSLFARPMPKANAICVPGVGMLMLFKQKFNYSQAHGICRNHSGHLADMTGESRTDSFAQLLVGAGVDSAYVGMTRDNSTSFRTVTGKPRAVFAAF
ncbi:hypothetical protein EVAR_65606_1 [Eumeta japonica]|uniref:C-type lectin domain-containing protein n=1 Tax=Eumeta variegata TaxID=151549 RepID=A0A4C1ZT47_EUMVA|nr:hypothetical protein EVAR_65606_1 [Eumeta japonica]